MSSLAGRPCSSIRQLQVGVDAVVAADFDPADIDEAVELVRALEVEHRRLVSAQLMMQAAIDSAGVHLSDGHASAKSFVRHIGRLSTATASSRDRSMRVLAGLPELAARFTAGEVGIDQVNLLGRVYANPRVAPMMPEADSWFCRTATTLTYRDFEAAVRQWQRLADEDGPEPANNRNHDQRNAVLIQYQMDLSWELLGSYAAFQGASMKEIFDRYVDAELAADWEKAKAELGEDACYADLPRTQPQRRADALWQIFQDAAASDTSAVPPGFVHNVIWDAETFEHMAAKLDTARPPTDRSNHKTARPETSRCETVDGIPLEPTEAIVNATVAGVRRVLVDAKGVTIDLGQTRRFTGNARHAVRLNSSHCVWPGCEVPASKCETDHLRPHADGGGTNPTNGAVMCGKHNRWKQKGFAVQRDQAGNWHTYRPSGDEVP